VQAEASTDGIPDVRFADRFGQAYRGKLSLATDANGRATAFPLHGLRVGPVRALVRLGNATNGERVTLTVLPGAAAELRIPTDTALILEWVAWNNMQRLMEPLGYLPTAEYEEQFHRAQTAHAAEGALT
jgi:hypothetical protein